MKNIMSRRLLIVLASLCASQAPANTPPTTSKNPTEKLRKIEGDIFIVPNALQQAQNWILYKDSIERALHTEIGSTDLLVQVWASSRDDVNAPTPGTRITAREGVPFKKELTVEERRRAHEINWRTVHLGNTNAEAIAAAADKSDNWFANGHPVLGECVFPGALPYDLMKDKREGDVFEIIITNKQGEKVVASLRCKQNDYRYGEHRYGKNFEGLLEHLYNEYTAQNLLTSVAKMCAYRAMRHIGAEKVLDTCTNNPGACERLFAQFVASESK